MTVAVSSTPRAVRLSLLSLATLAALSACSRLENVGQKPRFTAPGEAEKAPPPIAPQRVALATPPPISQAPYYAVGSLWRSGPESLFGDRRAKTLGDILTVVIELDEEAEIKNDTRRRRSGSEDVSVSAFYGLPALIDNAFDIDLDPSVGIESDGQSAGSGRVKRDEEITLRVAASVVEVLPNGHLVIAGNQEIRVNFELRNLQVAGIVRPEDISRRNEITYDKIAEARVDYGGRGQITDVQQPRYGQQVLDVVLPF